MIEPITTEMFSSLARSEFRLTANGEKKLTLKQNDTVISGDTEGKGEAGLAAHLHSTRKCPSCKGQMNMNKGKSGKFIMWCTNCKKSELISPEEINHYIYKYAVTCPKCKYPLEAKLGKYGVYLNCTNHCYPKLDEI